MNNNLSEVLDKIGSKKINNFLIELLKYDENIMNDFRSRFVNYFPKITKREYYNIIMNAITDAGGSDGYIDYNETSNYSIAMYGFISESKKLLEGKNYASAFDIVEVILDSIPDTDIDDSDGSTGEVASGCIEVIEDILGYALIHDENTSYRVLKYILDEVKTGRLNNYGIELYPLLDYFIDEKRYLEEIKNTINSYLKNHNQDDYKWERSNYVAILDEISNVES